MRDTTIGATTGTAGLTFPWWSEFIHVATGINQLLIAILGLMVLILTARKLWLENRMTSRKLRDLDREQ